MGWPCQSLIMGRGKKEAGFYYCAMNIHAWIKQVRKHIADAKPQLAKRQITEGEKQFTDAEGRATAALLKAELAEKQFKPEQALTHFSEAARGFWPMAAVQPEELALALIGQSAMLHKAGRYADAIASFEQTIAHCETHQLHNQLCRALRGCGFSHTCLGHHQQGIALTERSLQVAEQHDLPARQADALRNLAGICWDAGQDDQALAYNLRALQLARKEKDEYGIGQTLTNLSLLHASRHDYPRAQACIDEVKQTLAHRPEMMLWAHGSQFSLCQQTRQYEQGLHAAICEEELARQLNDVLHIGYALMHQSKALHFLGRNEEALAPIEEAAVLLRKLKKRTAIINAHLHLGRVHTALKNFAMGRTAITHAQKMAEEDKQHPYLFEVHELLSQLEEAAGDPRAALHHFKKAFEHRQKVFTTESESEMNRLKVQYETDVKERELQLLRHEKEKAAITYATAKKHYNLSPREHEILKLLVAGLSYKQTAAHLSISYETVRTHINNVYKKLEVSTNTEAVAKAIKEGLV